MDRRRRRRQSRPTSPLTSHIQDFYQPQRKTWSMFSAVFNLILMASLIASVYMMLEHHCRQCSSNCDSTIAKSLEEITQNLSFMNNNYQDLEDKVAKFSRELPKIEGQIEMLEALANNIENGKFDYKKIHLSLPNVDVAGPARTNVGDITETSRRTSIAV